MAPWAKTERELLSPVVETILADLEPLVGKQILVLCSASGEVAFRIADRVGAGEVLGLQLSEELLRAARSAKTEGIPVRFDKALPDRIPSPDATFDGVVSEFIVYPTSEVTDIGQSEMARVLRPSGVMTLTDVIAPEDPPADVRTAFTDAGLNYLCVATPDDFAGWMKEVGMVDVEVRELTDLVRPVWERRLATGPAAAALLLGSGPWSLGRGIRYIRVRGMKPTCLNSDGRQT
ncbi:MAG: methyltransferase domain-containing protein [Gammaproteobacteria bacterium]|nr:methyltransferase domain-containing protein [Gammaproteobacteria bacterium]